MRKIRRRVKGGRGEAEKGMKTILKGKSKTGKKRRARRNSNKRVRR